MRLKKAAALLLTLTLILSNVGVAHAAQPTVSIESSSYIVYENQTFANIPVVLSESSPDEVTVDYLTSPTPAEEGVDYQPVNGTLTFSPGQVRQYIQIPLICRADAQGDRYFVVGISNPFGATVGGISYGPVHIRDANDCNFSPGTIGFDPAEITVNEDDGVANMTLVRSDGWDGDAWVDYSTRNPGNAIPGQDFVAVSGTAFFPHGDQSPQTITIPILHNTDTGDEFFYINTSNTVGVTSGAQGKVNIHDIPGGSDGGSGSLKLSQALYTVSEAPNAVATITIQRVGGSIGAVDAMLKATSGAGVAGAKKDEDYGTYTQEIHFDDGDSTDKTIEIPIVDDNTVEVGGEDFSIEIITVAGDASLAVPFQGTVHIADNDTAPTGTIRLLATAANVNESAGSITVTVQRNGGSNGAASVQYATQDDTANAGSDYTAKSGTLNWADGDGADKTFSIAIINDTAIDAGERFFLKLSTRPGRPARAVRPTR
jgi:hypothetical protein